MRIVTRPIQRWPGELLAPGRRKRSPFKATWTQTQTLLEAEARMLGASEIVLQLALNESDIRMDGWPYARAKTSHPGVIVSVETKSQGPLSFPCDRFQRRWADEQDWHPNVRAVALAMEALRQVDRYGITRHGEQYVGWKALGSGIPMGEAQMTADEAARFLADASAADHPEMAAGRMLDGNTSMVTAAYREAAKRYHPDAGGDPATFKRLTEARDLLLAAPVL